MSSEGKDLKLFGKTIQLPEMTSPAADSRGVPPPPRLNEHLPSTHNTSHDNTHCNGDSDKDPSGEKLPDTNEDGVQPLNPEDNTDVNASIVTNENPEIDNEAARVKDSKTEEQEKTLKKPDKILPCPRCNSMDTKFCYYNNYNVSQPRHFCKKCQRYWTAGGTMRSMPVGSGRRKNKNSISASHYRHITVSEALQSAQLDLPNGTHQPNLKPNGTVLTFGLDPALCESKPNESHQRSDNGDDHSSGSSVTVTDSKGEVVGIGFSPQLPCFPGAPWTYPWNPMQLNSSIPPPALFPPGFPMPFYPVAPYWGCPVPGSWNVQWIAPPQTAGPNAPTLGKHSRAENELKSTNSGENEPQKENNPEKCLWFPKTLRIDDPEEAARSSIWATLGIQNEKAGGSVSGGRLFKPFQSKGDEKDHISEASRVLHANPAAMCRSLNFRESS